MQNAVACTKCLGAKVGSVLTGALALAIPVVALGAVVSGGQGLFGGPVIASSDDQVVQGFRIVDRPETSPADAPRVRAASEDRSDDVLLGDWRYTGKPNPSPGH